MKVKRNIKVHTYRPVKQKNPKVLKKLALSLAIVLAATIMYTHFLQPHTLEARQINKLQRTEQQLEKSQEQLIKSNKNGAQDQQKLQNLNKQLQTTQSQLQAKIATKQAYADAINVLPGWHTDCENQTALVEQTVDNMGLSADWPYMQHIFSNESCIDPGRVNSIGALGLGQSLGHASFTCGPKDITCQITWFNNYAISKGGWAASWEYWQAHSNW